MPSITINGYDLHVDRAGAGDPVVLVHGGWSGAAVWCDVATALRDRFDVVAYDRLGHNGSARPVDAYTRRRHEDDLIALVEELRIDPVHLVGSSYGAAIALSVAGRRPELVRSVVAHEPPLVDLSSAGSVQMAVTSARVSAGRIATGDVFGGTRQFFEDVALGPGGWATLPEAFRSMALSNAQTFVAEQHDARWGAIDAQALAAFAGRVLLTQGSRSPAWFAVVMDELARVVPHAEREILHGAGHSPHATHPLELASLLTDWMREEIPLASR